MKQPTFPCQLLMHPWEWLVMAAMETVAIHAVSSRTTELPVAVPVDLAIALPGRIAQVAAAVPRRLVTDQLWLAGRLQTQPAF